MTDLLKADVDVKMTAKRVARGLNGFGGPVWRWREATMQATLFATLLAAPINNPLNATMPGHAAPGGFKRGLAVDRRGSNQFQLRFNLTNSAPHAEVVEFGRRRTFSSEVFGWVGHSPPGEIGEHRRGTAGRPGTHVMGTTMAAVVAAAAR